MTFSPHLPPPTTTQQFGIQKEKDQFDDRNQVETLFGLLDDYNATKFYCYIAGLCNLMHALIGCFLITCITVSQE